MTSTEDSVGTEAVGRSEPQQSPISGEGDVKVTWVNDASNVNDRRMYVDGQQWAKVYGWDRASLNARCDALEKALTAPPVPSVSGVE